MRGRRIGKANLSEDWTQAELDYLRRMVVGDKIYCWEKLSALLNKEKDMVRKAWRSIVYFEIKGKQRIANTDKWSKQEDDILLNISKNKVQYHHQVRQFLTDRTPQSIEARLKRLLNQGIGLTPREDSKEGDWTEEEVRNFQGIGLYEWRKIIIKQIGKLNLSKRMP